MTRPLLLTGLFSAVTCVFPPPHASAAVVEHLTFDNATMGEGAGADSTAAGPFTVGAAVGEAGTARANAHNFTGTSTTAAGYHVESGQPGRIGQALRVNNPLGTNNPSNGNGGVAVLGVPPPSISDYSVSLWFNALGQNQGTVFEDGTLPTPPAGSGFLYCTGPNGTSSGNEGFTIAIVQASTPTPGMFRVLVRASMGKAGDSTAETGGGVAGSTLGPEDDDHRASMTSADFAVDAEWHNVVLVHDVEGSTVTIRGYLDGQPFVNVGGSGPQDNLMLLDGDGISLSAGIHAVLGARWVAATTSNYATMQNFRGLIDDFAVWEEALTDTDARFLHENGLYRLNAAAPLTDPDRDDDGMPDYFEDQYAFLNPLLATDAAGDQDADGLTNLREYQVGSNPAVADTDGDGLPDAEEVNVTHTDPAHADTDGDGLNDGQEATHGADPLLADTDGDGLTDGAEVNTHGTRPDAVDSDADGFPDGVEVASGSNPAQPASLPTLALHSGLRVYFPFDFASFDGFGNVADLAADPTGPYTGIQSNFGPNPVAGLLGDGAAMFLGGGDHAAAEFVDLASHASKLAPLTEGTIAAWVKIDPNSLQTGSLVLFALSDPFDASSEARLWIANQSSSGNGNLLWGVRNDGLALGNVGTPLAGPLLDDAWHHVAVTFTAATAMVDLYIDGKHSGAGVSAWFTSVGDASAAGVGRNIDNTVASGGQWFFDGLMDDFALWSRPLSQAEVFELHRTGAAGQPLGAPSPQAPLSVTQVTRSPVNGDVSLTWTSVPGVTYRLESSEDLVGWQLRGTVSATAAESTLTDTSLKPAGGARFYRIVRLP